MRDSTIIYAVIIFSIAVLIYGANANLQERTVIVDGNSEIEGSPDVFLASLGVELLDEDSEDAGRRANIVMEELKQGLFELGLDESNIIREEYRVNPRYDYGQRDTPIIGYSVYRALNIRVSDVELAGSILEAARTAGANQVTNVRFDLSDAKRKELRYELLASAKEDARLEAKAVIGNRRLGDPIKIDVNQQWYPMVRTGAMDTAEAMTIEPGVVTSSASVSVTYKIR